jgi:hypothetical protein
MIHNSRFAMAPWNPAYATIPFLTIKSVEAIAASLKTSNMLKELWLGVPLKMAVSCSQQTMQKNYN